MSKIPLEAEVERRLDEVEKQHYPLIWSVKPKDLGGKSTTGKPDRIWCLNGGVIGIEAKRVMKFTNKSTLPTVIQTRELQDLIKAGGAGCVVDLNSIDQFEKCIFTIVRNGLDVEYFKGMGTYKSIYCIDNWARYPQRIRL